MLSWAFEHRQREHVEFLLSGWGTGSVFVSDMDLSSPPPLTPYTSLDRKENGAAL